MHRKLQQAKRTIRAFLRAHYDDERLAMLLAHAQSGRLAFYSCCCFIGVATSDHALQGYAEIEDAPNHYHAARALSGAEAAEEAYGDLDIGSRQYKLADHARRRRLIPIVKAEIRRRDRLRAGHHWPSPSATTATGKAMEESD